LALQRTLALFNAARPSARPGFREQAGGQAAVIEAPFAQSRHRLS